MEASILGSRKRAREHFKNDAKSVQREKRISHGVTDRNVIKGMIKCRCSCSKIDRIYAACLHACSASYVLPMLSGEAQCLWACGLSQRKNPARTGCCSCLGAGLARSLSNQTA
jgi:hypothetical protein